MPAYLLISAYKKTSLKLVLPTLTPLLRLEFDLVRLRSPACAHQPSLGSGKGRAVAHRRLSFVYQT